MNSSTALPNNILTGVITVWFHARRYGFISPDGPDGSLLSEENNVFVHANDFIPGPPESKPYRGARVRFCTAVFRERVKAIRAEILPRADLTGEAVRQ